MITCEIKLFQTYFSLRRHPSEIILFQRVKTCLKLFQNYLTGLLQLMNILQRVHCRKWFDYHMMRVCQWQRRHLWESLRVSVSPALFQRFLEIAELAI